MSITMAHINTQTDEWVIKRWGQWVDTHPSVPQCLMGRLVMQRHAGRCRKTPCPGHQCPFSQNSNLGWWWIDENLGFLLFLRGIMSGQRENKAMGQTKKRVSYKSCKTWGHFLFIFWLFELKVLLMVELVIFKNKNKNWAFPNVLCAVF